MPITRQQLDEHIAVYGRYAFHTVAGQGYGEPVRRIARILDDGLHPRRNGHSPGRGYGAGGSGPIRDTHVYLSVPHHAPMTQRHDPAVFGAGAQLRVDLALLDREFFCLDEDILADPALKHLDWSPEHPDADLPEQVALSLRYGTFAYRGPVPAEAIALNPAYCLAEQLTKRLAQLPEPCRMFHVAPAGRAERIHVEGITVPEDTERNYPGSPSGVYLFESRELAIHWVESEIHHSERAGEPVDVWEVDAAGLELVVDEVYRREEEACGAWLLVGGDLGPDRLVRRETFIANPQVLAQTAPQLSSLDEPAPPGATVAPDLLGITRH